MDTGEPCKNPMLIKRAHKLEQQRDALLETCENIVDLCELCACDEVCHKENYLEIIEFAKAAISQAKE